MHTRESHCPAPYHRAMRRAPPLGIWLGAVLVSCASPAPQGRFFIDRAHQYAEAGDLERALSYTESAMQQQPSDPDPDEISLHVELLRRLDRDVEADAFEEFAGRYAAGAATDSEDTVPTLTECAKLERKRAHTTRLVREFGHPSPVSFEIGTLAATYEIDAEGRRSTSACCARVIRRPPG
jgi:hypothetical protein